MADDVRDVTLSGILLGAGKRLGRIGKEIPRQVAHNLQSAVDLSPVGATLRLLRSFPQARERERRGGEASIGPAPFAQDSSDPAVQLGAAALDPLNLAGAGLVTKGAKKISAAAKSLLPQAPYAEALRIAQANAAKPKSQGGLGLKKNNTPMERAAAMGYDLERPLYHGSLSDIKKIDLEKSTGEGHAGRGFYMTPSAEDASINYASPWGPDPHGKMLSAFDNRERGMSKRLQDALVIEKNLSPARLEKVVRGTGSGDNLGAVYPVYAKHGKEANLVEPKRSAWVDAAETYDEKADEYLPGPGAKQWERAQRTMRDFGVKDTPDNLIDAMMGDARMDEVAKALRGKEAYHPDTGAGMGEHGLATEVLRDLGANTFTHPTSQWRFPLNIAPSHTVALQPEGIVRSRFAAFDPARAGDPDMLGYANPKLLAATVLGGGATVGLASALRKKKPEEPKDKPRDREAATIRRTDREIEKAEE